MGIVFIGFTSYLIFVCIFFGEISGDLKIGEIDDWNRATEMC